MTNTTTTNTNTTTTKNNKNNNNGGGVGGGDDDKNNSSRSSSSSSSSTSSSNNNNNNNHNHNDDDVSVEKKYEASETTTKTITTTASAIRTEHHIFLRDAMDEARHILSVFAGADDNDDDDDEDDDENHESDRRKYPSHHRTNHHHHHRTTAAAMTTTKTATKTTTKTLRQAAESFLRLTYPPQAVLDSLDHDDFARVATKTKTTTTTTTGKGMATKTTNEKKKNDGENDEPRSLLHRACFLLTSKLLDHYKDDDHDDHEDGYGHGDGQHGRARRASEMTDLAMSLTRRAHVLGMPLPLPVFRSLVTALAETMGGGQEQKDEAARVMNIIDDASLYRNTGRSLTKVSETIMEASVWACVAFRVELASSFFEPSLIVLVRRGMIRDALELKRQMARHHGLFRLEPHAILDVLHALDSVLWRRRLALEKQEARDPPPPSPPDADAEAEAGRNADGAELPTFLPEPETTDLIALLQSEVKLFAADVFARQQQQRRFRAQKIEDLLEVLTKEAQSGGHDEDGHDDNHEDDDDDHEDDDDHDVDGGVGRNDDRDDDHHRHLRQYSWDAAAVDAVITQVVSGSQIESRNASQQARKMKDALHNVKENHRAILQHQTRRRLGMLPKPPPSSQPLQAQTQTQTQTQEGHSHERDVQDDDHHQHQHDQHGDVEHGRESSALPHRRRKEFGNLKSFVLSVHANEDGRVTWRNLGPIRDDDDNDNDDDSSQKTQHDSDDIDDDDDDEFDMMDDDDEEDDGYEYDDADLEEVRDMIYVRDSTNWKLPDVTDQIVALNGGGAMFYTNAYEMHLLKQLSLDEDDDDHDDDDDDD